MRGRHLDWFVNRPKRARGAGIWMLNRKELEGSISREPLSLNPEEVAMATLYLKQYAKQRAAQDDCQAIRGPRRANF
jgi:hypothetical protein